MMLKVQKNSRFDNKKYMIFVTSGAPEVKIYKQMACKEAGGKSQDITQYFLGN
jgi:hypothetical protein